MLIPDMYYFYYSNFANYKNVPPATLNAFKGADRTVDTIKSKAGLLTSIKYPTGGYTSFQYQPNNFSNYSYPDVSAIQTSTKSVYISDYNRPTDTKSASFILTNDQTIQFNNYIQAGPPNPNITFDNLLPSTITLSSTINGVTTAVKQWIINTAQRQEFEQGGKVIKWINDPVNLKANINYTIAVELPDQLGPQNTAMNQADVISSFNYYEQANNVPMITLGGGVRVSKITNFDNTGSVISNKIFKYINTDGTSSGKLMSELNFLYSQRMMSNYETGCQTCENGASYLLMASLSNVWFISSQSSIPYSSSAGGNPIGYSRVEEIDQGPGGVTNGKHIYYYHNEVDKTVINCPSIPDLANGLVENEYLLKSNGDTVRSISNFYYNHNLKAVNPLGTSYYGRKTDT